MACGCMDALDAKLAEHNTRLVRTFTIRPQMADFPKIAVEKINTRQRESVLALPSYCPFCGVAYAAPTASEDSAK